MKNKEGFLYVAPERKYGGLRSISATFSGGDWVLVLHEGSRNIRQWRVGYDTVAKIDAELWAAHWEREPIDFDEGKVS